MSNALIAAPGLYPDLDENTYHADASLAPSLGRSLSSTGAKTILDCPARFHWQRSNPVHKAAFDFGSVAHARLLGVGQDIDVLDFDSWRSKAATEARDTSRAAGHVPILRADSDRADAFVAAVRKHPVAAAIFAEGVPEQSLYWIDQETGITCRGRLDWQRANAIVDFKTAQSANPARFARSAVDFGYALQSAWYVDGFEAVTGERLPFIHVVAEKEAPHLVSVIQFDDEALDYGRTKAAQARRTYAECESSGIWPAYSDDIEHVSLPRWAS